MAHKAKVFRKKSITVAFMVKHLREDVGLEILPVNEVDTETVSISEADLHRPGLALAGYLGLFTHQRVQILGNTESRYLRQLSDDERIAAFQKLLAFKVPCICLTDNNTLDERLVYLATSAGLPIYRTPIPSTRFMRLLGEFLDDQFALQQTIHGSLVDVYGIGLLLKGEPGIGKSEVALDLIERGHRLVADDVVVATKKAENVVMGAGTAVAQHFMEIRGLGLVDVRAMFGIRAIRFQKRIELVVEMHPWDSEVEYSRIGMIDDHYPIMDVSLPLVKLPIIPGKNITVICEVIAMNHLLNNYGYDPAKIFAARLADKIKKKQGNSSMRGVEYFEHDYE